ncbi:MAG: hypothetical protein ACQESE_04970 [Nanobdellota archaeon]
MNEKKAKAYEYIKNNLSSEYAINTMPSTDFSPLNVVDDKKRSIDIYFIDEPKKVLEKKYYPDNTPLTVLDYVDEEVIKNEMDDKYTVVIPINPSSLEQTVREDISYKDHHKYHEHFGSDRSYDDAVEISNLRDYAAVNINGKRLSATYNTKSGFLEYNNMKPVFDKEGDEHDMKKFFERLELYTKPKNENELEIHLPENDQYNIGVIVPKGSNAFKQYINK